MNLEQKTMFVRGLLHAVEAGSFDTADNAARTLKDKGFVSNACVGQGKDTFTPESTLDWYVGQFLSIVENKSWWAMNSLLNALDTYIPAPRAPKIVPEKICKRCEFHGTIDPAANYCGECAQYMATCGYEAPINYAPVVEIFQPLPRT